MTSVGIGVPQLVMSGLQNMKAVEVPIYDFTTHQRSTESRRVEPADVVIIEGILVLHIKEIRSLLNMKIFVDTDDDLRLARRSASNALLQSVSCSLQ
jgi:uridine kinase